MAVDFIAIDWETANAARGSACAVGLVEVRDGEITDTWSSLMQPPDQFSSFDANNTAVHGLRAEDVVGAPRFDELWQSIEERLLPLTVVAHNAKFDIGVIQDATGASRLRSAPLRYGCTLLLARRHYNLDSYTLDVVSEAAGVSLTHHHDALSDSLAAAQVLLKIIEDVGATSVEEAFEIHGLALGWSGGPDRQACQVAGRSRWERITPGEITPVESTLW
jgi:DNA polymerase III subunit epsilon